MKRKLFLLGVTNCKRKLLAIVCCTFISFFNLQAQVDIARWTYEPLQGTNTNPTPNTGSGSSAIVGAMSGAGTGTGMSGTGCGSQVSGTTAWAIGTANPGTTNESSGVQYNVSTVGYSSIIFTWDQRFSNTATNTVRLQYTTNGSTWTNFTMTSGNTTVCNGTINANGQFEAANASGDLFRRTTVDLSSVSAINNNSSFGVRLVAAHFQSTGQFRQTTSNTTVATAGTWRFDNVAVRGTSTITPTITGAATASAFTTTYGTASASQSFAVSGSNLTANITATAPTGFEVSSNNTVFGSTATITQSGGSASGTIYIRLAATAAVSASYNAQNIVLSSTGATNVNITSSSSGNTVAPAALTISGVSASNKIYDGNTTATLSGTPTYNGLVNGESFIVTGTPVAVFADAVVNNGVSVSVSGYTPPSGNYTVSQPGGLTANITAKQLTISGLTADNKVFDGNTTATLSGTATLVGVITSDIPNVILGGTYIANFADPNIANNIPVSVSGYTLFGSASANYTLQQPSGLTANITATPLQNQTITFDPLAPVTYGDAAFTLTATASSGLPVSYSSSNPAVADVVGSTVTVYSAGSTLITASQPGNGSYNPAPSVSQNLIVNPKSLTITGASGVSKVYDSFNTAAISGATLSGVVGSDNVTVSGGGTFTDANVGVAKPITAALVLGGTDAPNYTLIQPTGLSADINALNLTITGLTANNKVFDGNTSATLSGTAALNGVLASDAGNVSLSGTPIANFASSAVGNGIAVSVTGYTLSGSASGNYTVSQPAGLTANITAPPTTLAAGDIAIIGYTTTGAAVDNFAILVLKDLTSGTVFYVNDNEVLTAGGTSFADLSEGEASFTVKSGQTVTAGTVIILPWGSAAVSTTTYDYSSTSGFGLGNNNEELYIYTASSITSATPSAFIYFAKIGTSTAAVPAGLAAGTTAISPVGGSLRYVTSGALYNSCVPNLLAAIANTATNWNSTGATSMASTDWTFTVLPSCPDTPPTIVMNVASTSNLLDGAAASSPASPYAFSGVISDPTDPASTLGFDFTIGDAETAVGSLTVTVSSSNTTVVPLANAVLSGSGASRNLKITPSAVGYSNVSVNVNDGTNTTTYVIAYAASAAAVNPATTRFHLGRSDASTAVMIDNDYMLVADDENQALRLYDRNNSGLSVNSFDFTTSLGLTDISGGIPREVDIESSVRSGNRIYWLGSHNNSSSGSNRPNRSRIFATDITGSGASTELTYVGRFDDLKTQLLAWDNTNAHGLGADYFGLTASAAVGVLPEAADGSGFNIEGLTLAPDNTTGYICFRAPISPASSRTNALIVPVTNFTSLFSGNPTSATATFGAPIMLNLGGRGIREIKKNAANQYLIIAGPVDAATDIAPSDFVLYSWTGNSTDNPVALTTSLSSLDLKGSFEGIVDVANPIANGNIVQLVIDNGDNVYYNDAIIAKDLANGNHKKASSITVTLSGVVFPPVINSSLTASGVAGANFTYTITAANTPTSFNATGLPANLSVNTSTGVISGIPAAAGLYNITISATNAAGTDVETLALTVAASYTYYADVDGDTYGNPLDSITSVSPTPPTGYVANNQDCDDTNAAINPLTTWYLDADNDNYYTGSAVVQCLSPGVGYKNSGLIAGGDCNDALAAVNPGVAEVCNSIDDDCDSSTDEGVTTNYYADVDGDTYGAGPATAACTSPGPGFVTNNTDCNDNAAAVNPGATETCNSIDDDCDGASDEGFDLNGNTIADCLEFLFSEIMINPPSTDNGQEYIEIKGQPNTSLTNVRLLMIEGDGTATGVVDQNIDLSSYTTGSNGLLLIRDAASVIAPAPDAGTSVVTLDFNPDIENGSNTFILGLGTAPAVNTDLDGNNDGTLNAGALSGFAITDAVSIVENDGASNYAYADDFGFSVLGPFAGYNPDLLYRTFNANGSPCIWTGGDVTGTAGGPYAFDFVNNTVFGFQQHGVTSGVSSNPGSVNQLFDDNSNGTANACEAITISGVVTHETCQNLNDGTIDIAVFGLSFPYTYTWSNGQSTQDIDSLDAGVYTVTVTGALGEIGNASFTVNPGIVALTYYADADSDSYGNAAVTVIACMAPTGYVFDDSDCDDTDPAVNPDATEVCNGIDDDCDGDIDANDNSIPVQNWYPDADGDTYGDANASATVSGCPIVGFVLNNSDCDDGTASVNPAAAEVCNGVDDDCDGLTDDGVTLTFYADADGDGFGNAAVTATGCYPAPGFVFDNSDCNDGNANVNPSATEVCNGIDDDCDGDIDANDNSIPVQNWYPDADGDTYGDANASATVSGCPIVGFVLNNSDCDDGTASVNPAAAEVCNGVDDDCDGLTDDGVTLTFYADADGDGFGNASVTATGCYPAPGFVFDNSDCNDANANVNPSATEVCNGIDDDCDGDIDANDSSIPVQNWYPDTDGDSYGDANASATVSGCPIVGFVLSNNDCDDNNPAVNPGAAEICDALDNDCDGQTDEGLTLVTWYADVDGDGFGGSVLGLLCYQPAGAVAVGGDCNDGNAAIRPNATEVCNNIDDNCNGQTDEGVLNTYYTDADGDGFGAGNPILACTQPSGTSLNNLDCNDTLSSVNPAATEICNSIDDNCNGQTDEGVLNTYYTDADGDGFGAGNPILACTQPSGTSLNNLDCNDGSNTVNPGASEVCGNAVDDNCNGQTDEGCNVNVTYFRDADSDTFGNPNDSIVSNSPTPPSGYVVNNLDCNDSNAAIFPGATETCNGIDDDCDGTIDDGFPTFTASITATGGQFSFCPASSVQLNAVPSGPGYTFNWSTGAGTPSITVNTVGQVSVTITNGSGCSSTATVNITQRRRPSDFNADGITNVVDFLSLLSIFNQNCTGCPQDLNNDGVVNVVDFLALLTEFGLSCQ